MVLTRVRNQLRATTKPGGSGIRVPSGLQRERPGVPFGGQMFELGQLVSNRVESHLKGLASIKASALISFPS